MQHFFIQLHVCENLQRSCKFQVVYFLCFFNNTCRKARYVEGCCLSLKFERYCFFSSHLSLSHIVFNLFQWFRGPNAVEYFCGILYIYVYDCGTFMGLSNLIMCSIFFQKFQILNFIITFSLPGICKVKKLCKFQKDIAVSFLQSCFIFRVLSCCIYNQYHFVYQTYILNMILKFEFLLTDSVLAVACHPSQSLIASGGHGQDLTVRLWRATLTPINTQISSHLDDLNTTPTQ